MWQTSRQSRHRRTTRALRPCGVLTLGLLSAACQGVLGADDGENGANPDDGHGASGDGEVVCVGDVCSEAEYAGPGEVPMRRLNNAEFMNTVHDLFGSSTPPVSFPEEGRTHGFDTLHTALAVSQLHVEAYLDAAEALVTELFDVDPGGVRASWCDFTTEDEASNLDCAGEIVENFAELAWRRPLEGWPDEQPASDSRALLAPDGKLAEFDLETRLRTALEAVLVSPRFVHRVELADESGDLDGPSLAARLSYFLWSSAPDAELLASELHDEAVLKAQAARMQDDERFQRFLERFPDLWLELEKLATVERDPEVYPDFSPALAAAMAEETRGFFAGFWMNPDARVSDLLLAEPTGERDPMLQDLYGDSPRLGLITQAAVMTVTGVSNRTAPVRRGMWVLERILCAPPPPPPEDVIAELTAELEEDDSLTERERLAQHRVDPACANCHVTMDAIGLGFENYDSIGAYREVDATGMPIDASGVLPGADAPFDEPLELVSLLAEDERVRSCVVRQLLTYGAGRTFGREDDALIDVVQRFAGGSEATFQSVLNGVILSDAFRRRNEEQ